MRDVAGGGTVTSMGYPEVTTEVPPPRGSPRAHTERLQHTYRPTRAQPMTPSKLEKIRIASRSFPGEKNTVCVEMKRIYTSARRSPSLLALLPDLFLGIVMFLGPYTLLQLISVNRTLTVEAAQSVTAWFPGVPLLLHSREDGAT